MGQERFADVVERFTSGHGAGPAATAEAVKQWEEEFDRQARRVRNLGDMLFNPTEPKTGPTPRQEVYRRNKSRLYRYESRRRHRTPLLFVPNLGISRPYIFDLLPVLCKLLILFFYRYSTLRNLHRLDPRQRQMCIRASSGPPTEP